MTDTSLQSPVATACPLCGTAGRPLFEKRTIPIADCPVCGHRFAAYTPGEDHVARVYGDTYFDGGSGEYAAYEREADGLRARGMWYGELLKRFAEPGRLLDVGAASGFVLEGLIRAGWTGIGIEPNAVMAERARARGIRVAHATLESLETDVLLDAVTLVQVFSHFYDLRAAIARCAAVTKPGGVWLIETWDRDSFVARVLRTRWHEYNPPSVLHWFSKATLRAFLAEYGFVYLADGRPPKGITGAHAKSVLQADQTTLLGRAVGSMSRLLPDQLYVPYPGDDVFWMAFRKGAVATEEDAIS